MKKFILILVCLSFSIPIFAESQSSSQNQEYKDNNRDHYIANWLSPRLYVGAYGGYGNINGTYHNDGQFGQGRLALGVRVAQDNILTYGVEVGVQSGNTMRLSANSALIETAGGLPIQSTLKPLEDLLFTVEGQILHTYPLFGIVKAGIAYRQLTLNDRTSSRDSLNKVNGEFQAGLAYNLTDHARISVFYQGIYGGADAGLALDSAANVTIGRIPTQQAGFLGFEYLI